MPFAIELPSTLPFCQNPEDLGVVGPLMEPIKRLRGDRVKIIELVDRLRAEVYQQPTHQDLFHDMGGEVSVEFLYHDGWYSARHPLFAIVLRKKSSGWWNPFSLMNDLFLKMVPNHSATPSLKNLVRLKFGVGSSLARPRLEVKFHRLLDIGVEGWVALDLRLTKWRTGAE